jgi:hypothetical protein
MAIRGSGSGTISGVHMIVVGSGALASLIFGNMPWLINHLCLFIALSFGLCSFIMVPEQARYLLSN